MRTLAKSLLLLAAAGACFAQKWEFGVNGGASVVRGLSVKSGSDTATAGFKTSGAFGVFVGQNLYKHVGGEVRYEYLMGDLRVKSGGTEATFGGSSHAIHYDVILHTANQDSRRQFFVAIGGGMKVYQGTGRETAFQPLYQFIYMTKTRVVKPMASLGGGMKYRLSPHAFLRTEIRDFITPFPEEILTPAIGAKLSGHTLHNFVPMAGISWEF